MSYYVYAYAPRRSALVGEFAGWADMIRFLVDWFRDGADGWQHYQIVYAREQPDEPPA